MELIVLGTNHRIASVEWRSRLAFSAAEAIEWLPGACLDPAVHEALVLSTCNRVEFYAVTSDARGAEAALRRAVNRSRAGDWLAPGPHRYMYGSSRALRHLCRVACGLDSMLIGEAEILGQIRAALATAARAGTLGRTLERVFHAAVHAGRRARSETRIGVGVTSVPAAAVSVAEDALGSLAGRSVLVIGAGKAARLAAERAAKRRPARLTIANRSSASAEALAKDVGGHATPMAGIGPALEHAELVISAIHAPGFVVGAEILGQALAGRSGGSLVCVDLGVPPAIDPAVCTHDGVTLYGLDELKVLVGENAQRRRDEMPSVEAIAAEEADRLACRLAGFGLAPKGRAVDWSLTVGAVAAY